MDDEDRDYNAEWGYRVGPMMKGVLMDGDILSWHVDKKGRPHHDDVDPMGNHSLEFSHFNTFLGITGLYEPITSVGDILNFFEGYKNDDEIEVNVYWAGGRIGSSLREPAFDITTSVGNLKTFFKHHPPPVSEDYEDGLRDVEFIDDYWKWTKKVQEKTTAQEILGRGGREDVWQERDEDFSKSFSVYNPRRKKRRKC